MQNKRRKDSRSQRLCSGFCIHHSAFCISPMTRRLLNLVTALSLILAAVVTIQWYRGYRGQDSLSVRRVVGSRENPVEERFNVVTCTGAFWFSIDSSSDNGTYDPSIITDWRQR